MIDFQFDNVSRLFAQRRVSRRHLLARSGASVAGGALAASHLKAASAQDATPVGSNDSEDVMTLFVQSFQSGSFAPKPGEEGTYTLTLDQGLGQTIYFSDRPERIVGATPTPKFLKGLGFSAGNPPNAALLLEPEPGHTDIAVLELFEPRYDETSHTAIYDVRVLKDYEKALGMTFADQPIDLSQLHPAFGAAHLFIDGCPDTNVACWDYASSTPKKGTFPGQPFCYLSSYGGCLPCGGTYDTPDQITAYWNKHCNDTFSACGGNCYAEWNLT